MTACEDKQVTLMKCQSFLVCHRHYNWHTRVKSNTY